MRINGPNNTNMNPYKNHFQKQVDTKTEPKKDQLEISSKAKEMLEKDKPNAERAAYVQEIKQAVENGEYKVDHEKTARKMIDFWSGF
ncbi:flagellar biosynthesis anti-sigma factor FlgM [Virgibacillus halodenitrificans]|uniref:Negative regulator of flagellin synthesis n=1 Tax=Virgibacillus halodenitrificans TaxID=1482 RepID=A0ABR7VPM1_VIRHA|nr:flagellar biosynthesis anti-sigma factor FlgM [Virgibacillus halodenitrificans]MBD1223205.1 flagellar biosynthesis anti-sigma factor FlgM [Virgibacillus halodenitrificans]MEC2160535.1 flagellar biosynthesis anti-sigma factor FlgM [Virgibacillus halodenitrificans]WHX26747.1 flagellar biosynthesis anti-sigma factor FlgM [Virgibacillus halodenitrificans]